MRRTLYYRLAKIGSLALLAGFITNCGSSSTSTSKTPTGTLITIVQDVPICNAISAAVVIEDLNFSQTSGGATANYLNTTAAFAPEIRVNLPQYRDFSAILYEYPVNEGSYTQANLSFELGQLSAYDPTLSPPIHVFPVTFVTSKPIITIDPPLQIKPNQANVMVLDFDLLRMLETDSEGNITGEVNPVANITQLTALLPTGATNPNGFGVMDDLWGFVRSVSNSNTTSNPSYIGDFQMQLMSPSTADAPEVAINFTNNTNKVGFSDLAHLLPDSYVEVNATLDSQGNLAANTVEFQALENPFPKESGVTPSTALIGPIQSITTNAAGTPTSLNLWVHDAEPDDTSTLTMDSIYQVDLTTNPTYQASVMGPNFANLSFGPLNLAVGQELVVHGAYTKPPTTTGTTGTTSSASQPFQVEPTAIFLKLQSLQGRLNTMLAVGSDDATGVFILTPCCTLWNGVPIYVVTNNQTAYVNVTGLGEVNAVNSLLVKGMPYYEPQAVTVNGVTIPAGSMVVQAKQVHVLQ